MILLYIALGALLFMGLLAPFETLGWWAGWYDDLDPGDPRLLDRVQSRRASRNRRRRIARRYREENYHAPPAGAASPSCFLVQLTGTGGVKPERLSSSELRFLTYLQERIPGMRIVKDVFPYSVSNRGLTKQRKFSGLWRRLERFKFHRRLRYLGWLINIRNMWQILVSADGRYGPLYNQATAELIWLGLLRQGYREEHAVPVVLLGLSGGGQVAIGTAPYLRKIVDGPVHVISLGGVFFRCVSPMTVDSITHLYGTKDVIHNLGAIFAPRRWPFGIHSQWNRARRRGTAREVSIGPISHMGKGNYMDHRSAVTVEGRTALEVSLDAVEATIRERVLGEVTASARPRPLAAVPRRGSGEP